MRCIYGAPTNDMSYELNREDIISFAQFIQARTKTYGDELMFEFCPRCQGGGKDKETFSINLENGAFNCLRASCGYKGHFVELARDFDFPLETRKPTIYIRLPQPKEKVRSTDHAIEYMKSRGISEDITRRYEITTSNKSRDILLFPFFDEKGVLQFIKYRNMKFVKGKTPGNKEWAEKQTMPILFGMKQATDYSKPLIVTEGQIDSLSVAQAGIPNAVSVPTGAKGMTFYPICRDWIERFPEVIIFGDYENGKITLVDEFKARLSKPMRVVQPRYYLGEKDANDILCKYGTKAIQLAVENAKEPSIGNVLDIASVTAVNVNDLDKIPTGVDELDRVLGGGICMGQLALLTGPRGEGKSTLLSMIGGNGLNENESVFFYSGELAGFHLKHWLDLQLAGEQHLYTTYNEFGDPQYGISDDVQRRINDWYRGRAFVYDNDYIPDDKGEMETLPDTIERVIKAYNCKLICIDNLMTAMEAVHDKDSLYLAQSNFVGKLKKIAMKFQVAIILVAHPRKSTGVLTNDDVSGSADITNKCDIVMTYARDPQGDGTQALLQITKNRLFGKLRLNENAIKLIYSPASKRVLSVNQVNQRKIYGWENSYAIKEVPQDEPKKPEPIKEEKNDDDDLPF